MEFLATEMHDKLYPPSSNSASAQTLVELLLDHIPISPKSAVDLVGPPVQLRQYTRYLQNAAGYANAVRNEALSLSPEVRKAIGALVETPAPGTRNPNNILEKLSAIQWRLLMIKRGMQGIIRSRQISPSETVNMRTALRNAMQNVGYAQECVEDIESNGPKVEDARMLVEEMERSTRGTYLLELRKEMERRLEAGIAGRSVEEALISHGLSPATVHTTRRVYRRIRQYEEFSPRALDIVTKALEEDNMAYAKKWRRKPFTRCQRIFNVLREHSETLDATLDRLIALHPEHDEKITLLREAKEALELSTEVDDEYIRHITGKVKGASWLEWAEVVSSRLDLVGELVERVLTADRHLEQYAWGESGVWEVDADKKNLFFDARMELVIIFDVAWRLERRMKQDVEDLREASILLCEEVRSEFHIPRPTPKEPGRLRTNISPWQKSEHRVKRPFSDRNRPKPTHPIIRGNPSPAEEINAFLIFDE
ncbi:hypothetical protein B0J17DRAFT_315059 [Rhizoctonia solani]|nr:hypothetical protein B0J17DRAFT_315059 [Rhizoctonia solani]